MSNRADYRLNAYGPGGGARIERTWHSDAVGCVGDTESRQLSEDEYNKIRETLDPVLAVKGTRIACDHKVEILHNPYGGNSRLRCERCGIDMKAVPA